jgi:hypothetical protein
VRTLFLVASATLIAAPTSAQEWTAEEREVWAFEMECSAMSAADRVAQCFHEAYTGWYAGDPIPVDLDDQEVSNRYWAQGEFVSARPLMITVVDNVAVVHLMIRTAVPQPDGSTILEWSRWTDVLLNDGGRWGWIADAGGEVKLYGGDGSGEDN